MSRRHWQAVLLDRDGTVNVKAEEGRYVSDPEAVELLPGAASAVAAINRAGIPTVLVTNQRWLSGGGPEATSRYARTHARLVELLAVEGAWLDAAYHCPHEVGCCRCRKPQAGMLYEAARDLRLDLSSAVVVGDAVTDVQAGRAVGAATVLICRHVYSAGIADIVVPDLAAAAQWILEPEDDGLSRQGSE